MSKLSLHPAPLSAVRVKEALQPLHAEVWIAYRTLRDEALQLIEAVARTDDAEALEDAIDELEWLPRLAVRKVIAQRQDPIGLTKSILEEMETEAGLHLISNKGWLADSSKFTAGKLTEPEDVHFAKQHEDMDNLRDKFLIGKVSHRIYSRKQTDAIRRARSIGRERITDFKNFHMSRRS